MLYGCMVSESINRLGKNYIKCGIASVSASLIAWLVWYFLLEWNPFITDTLGPNVFLFERSNCCIEVDMLEPKLLVCT